MKMTVQRKRVKTGCLTCRQRRVKCDEGKPVCQRCEAANISCSGYQPPRRIGPKSHSPSSQPASRNEEEVSPPSALSHRQPSPPLVDYPGAVEGQQRPHRRAMEVLAHKQYSSKTAPLLFSEVELRFWRDRLVELALSVEYVFDAVVALGTMHIAVLLLSNHGDQQIGLDTKVAAFESYGNALKHISDGYGRLKVEEPEALVAVLLLLTYFECFAGNPTAAVRHLSAARQHLCDGSVYGRPNYEVLISCANDLSLAAQIVLPLSDLRLVTSASISGADRGSIPCVNARQDLHDLLRVIRAYNKVNTAIWSPCSHTEFNLDVETVTDFQSDLQRWKSRSRHIFPHDGGFAVPLAGNPIDWDVMNDLPIPPSPQHATCMEAAVAASLFSCYMGRTTCILSVASGGDETLDFAAYAYAYHTICIAEGIRQGLEGRSMHDRSYIPCNAVKIGITPILFLVGQFCYNQSWRQWIISRLHRTSQEGLYNGSAFAVALEPLDLFEAHFERSQIQQPSNSGSPQIRPLISRIVPISFPDVESKILVSYYVRIITPRTNERKEQTQVIGTARWNKEWESYSKSLSLEFFSNDHPMNDGHYENCVYGRLQSHDAIAKDWMSLLSPELYGHDAYFVNPSIFMGMTVKASEGASGPVFDYEHALE